MLENYPCIHFERYADDIVVHCRTREQAVFIKERIEDRLKQCKLQLNAEKTRIVYCKDSNRDLDSEESSFDFLGFNFRPRSARNKSGRFFVSFSPAISKKAATAIRQTVRRDWQLKQRTFLSLNELAKRLNPVILGWINYYGKFCRSALYAVFGHINAAITGWVSRKFKRFRGHKTRAAQWLKGVARRDLNLFVHWRCGFVKAG